MCNNKKMIIMMKPLLSSNWIPGAMSMVILYSTYAHPGEKAENRNGTSKVPARLYPM